MKMMKRSVLYDVPKFKVRCISGYECILSKVAEKRESASNKSKRSISGQTWTDSNELH